MMIQYFNLLPESQSFGGNLRPNGVTKDLARVRLRLKTLHYLQLGMGQGFDGPPRLEGDVHLVESEAQPESGGMQVG